MIKLSEQHMSKAQVIQKASCSKQLAKFWYKGKVLEEIKSVTAMNT